jgi:DNA-binding GntR family transcriptional regulator
VSVPRRGTFVRDISFASVKVIMEIRGRLESLCARYIREANRAEDLDLLRERLRDLETAAATGDNRAFLAADMAFHEAIWQCSRREDLICVLAVALKPFFLRAARALSPEQSPASERLEEHRRYLAIIETAPDNELESAVEEFYRRTAEKVRHRAQPAVLTS